MQHNIVQSYQTAGGSVTGTLSVTAETELNFDLVVPASSADLEIDIAFAKAKVMSCVLFATTACTVETNATDHTGGDSISLTANQPTICKNNTEAQALFTHDVTKFYVTCSAGCTLSFRALLDLTP